MTTVVLARHGETDWNREGRFQGHADPPLNDNGRAQARELAARLSGDGITAVWTSDLQRAHETAEIVAARLGLDVRGHPGLREIDVGSWAGLTRDEVAARYPDGFERWQQGEIGHDGESRDQLVARVSAAVLEIATAHDGERLLLVAHGGAIRALQRHVLGAPQPVLANCATFDIVVVGGVLRSRGNSRAPTS